MPSRIADQMTFSVPVVIDPPEEVHIQLVPLSAVQEVFTNQFWATIMLTIWSAIVSAGVSLLLSPPRNLAVVGLLAFFFLLFSAFCVVFCRRWWSARRRLDRETVAAARAKHRKLDIPFEPTRRSQ